jgi:hypothetical protein
MDGSFSWKRHGLKNLVLDVFKNNFTFYGKRQLDENLGKVRLDCVLAFNYCESKIINDGLLIIFVFFCLE